MIYILTSAQVRGDDYRRALGAEHLRRVEIMQTRKFFRDLGPFKHWRPESFMQLADKATRRHIPAHAVVARRGASCDTVAFVVQGELKLEGAVAVGTQRKSVRICCRACARDHEATRRQLRAGGSSGARRRVVARLLLRRPRRMRILSCCCLLLRLSLQPAAGGSAACVLVSKVSGADAIRAACQRRN